MRCSIFVQYAKMFRRYCNNFVTMSLSYFLSFSFFFIFFNPAMLTPFFHAKQTTTKKDREVTVSCHNEERINLQDDELLTCVVRQTPQDTGIGGGNSYLPPHNRSVARSRNVVAWYVNYFITRRAEIAGPWR